MVSFSSSMYSACFYQKSLMWYVDFLFNDCDLCCECTVGRGSQAIHTTTLRGSQAIHTIMLSKYFFITPKEIFVLLTSSVGLKKPVKENRTLKTINDYFQRSF